MDNHTAQFQTYRALLFSIAYRMLGTVMEAEDVLQDAYIRYASTNFSEIDSHKYYLTTIVTRLCINRLQAAWHKREVHLGSWLPEPVATASQPPLFVNPAEKASTDDSISTAFLLLLEKLSAAERAVFLLREVFDYEYSEIATMLSKTEAACRQLFSRAKKHLRHNRPRFEKSPEVHAQLLKEFMKAVTSGDLEGLVSILAEDAVLLTDGGDRKGRATRPVQGAQNIAQFVLAFDRISPPQYTVEVQPINGTLGVVVRFADRRPYAVMTLEVVAGKIQQIFFVGDDNKLQHV